MLNPGYCLVCKGCWKNDEVIEVKNLALGDSYIKLRICSRCGAVAQYQESRED